MDGLETKFLYIRRVVQKKTKLSSLSSKRSIQQEIDQSFDLIQILGWIKFTVESKN